ncbi:MAG TPA: hypothetical protein VFZ22_16740 [Pyrinomonadaceae bacterium]|nr:hypothetical protein [Pyrinomonadaceae bacterium]
MRSIPFFILMVAIVTRTASAQQADSPNLWLIRSQTITAELIKDSADLATFERALLLAGLAKRWWRDDSEKARSWIVKAIEIVEVIPNKENADERRARLRTARSLLQIVTPIDQKLSKRLIALLSDRAEQISEGEREANADGLINAANVLVDSDPKRAAELGALALRVGRPTEIQGLIVRLRSREPKLSDELFRQTLVVARQTLDVGLLNSLSHAAFPESRTFGAVSKIPTSDNLRAEVLRLYLAYLQSNPISAENRSSICRSGVSFIAPVLTEFDRLVPEQASNVRQFIHRCQSDSPLTRQRLEDAQRDKPLNTVEDLLKAAADSEDIKVRTVYQYRAASLAKSQNDIEQALKILDSMSAESREFMGESWLSYRWDWAALAALNYFKAGDIYRMRLVINDVPLNLQPFAKIAFIQQLPATTDKDTDPTLEFLDDARTGLRRSSFTDNEKCGWYFSLLPLTVKYQTAQATDVLREAVSLLNRIENPRDKKGNNDGSNVLIDSLSKNLPASLLEMDEYIVKEAVSSIVSPSARVKVRLELLAACLERLKNTSRTTARNSNL